MTDTNTVTLFCPVGPRRSSLMNIVSVYRKQAFITSSRLAARHTELDNSAHTCMCTHGPWHTASHVHHPLIHGWSRRPAHFIQPSLAQHIFISFLISLSVDHSLSKGSRFLNYYTLPLRVGLICLQSGCY